MIFILSRTTKKHQNTLSRPLHSKLMKIQGLFKEKWNPRISPKIQALFKTGEPRVLKATAQN